MANTLVVASNVIGTASLLCKALIQKPKVIAVCFQRLKLNSNMAEFYTAL
ncbi:hypothetical protein INT80_04160 [Gallibacterium anatis]|uniref:Uncharacterized protein n=1 Tax=Gallibacterium anatis TaxID=750 RepID=A0A930Y8F7_9PAST|nr:hypothetical protein [Gallibacterium anatis]